MKITKTVMRTYEINFVKKSFLSTAGEFLRYRKSIGAKTEPYERCFICGRKFADNEIPRVVIVTGIGNRFICKECEDKCESDVK